MHTKKLGLFSLTLLASFALHATPTQERILIAPTCLLKNLALNTNYKTLSSHHDFNLISTNEEGITQFIEAKHKRTITPCGGFMDATDSWQKTSLTANHFLKKNTAAPQSKPVEYSINYPEQVNALLKQFDSQIMWEDLRDFSNTSKDHFPDRYPNSKTGIKAATWLKEKIEAMAKENNRSDITTYTVATGTQYKQPSVVVKIGNSTESGIVIGGHMDTLSSWNGVKPGADDDGSGSMTVMSVARTLINSGMQFKKPIYIIWYSAEEQGLVGSGYVVKDFKAKKIPVDAVLQFDMTGYADKNDPTIWLVNDYVNKDLTAYLKTLVETYVKQPVGMTHCGYACSDHASWHKGGFTAAFPFEAAFNHDDPYIHTSEDTMDVLSQTHMADYAKLGIAFAVELAQPV